MSQPRVPGDDENTLELPCGQTMVAGELDLGMREFKVRLRRDARGRDGRASPERFLPDFLVEVLREAIETTSEEMPEFDTPHLLGVVLEEFPEAVVAYDASENADVGYAMAWVTEFDSRRLHEIVVELVVELMEHAVSHADDDEALSAFEQEMVEFDVAEFVDQYRAERDL